jgi:hypothetical protein
MSKARYVDQEPEFKGQCAAAVRDPTSADGWRRCRAKAINGKAVCKTHGGMTPIGPANPNYKHGARSIVNAPAGRYTLSEAQQARYDRYRANEAALLESFDELALLVARIQELLDRVTTAEGHATPDIFKAFDGFDAALASGNAVKTRETLAVLRSAVDRARGDMAAWDQIADLIDRARRLRSVEVRRITAAREMMTAEQAMAFTNALLQISVQVCAMAPTKELETAMRNTFALEVQKLLDQPVTG